MLGEVDFPSLRSALLKCNSGFTNVRNRRMLYDSAAMLFTPHAIFPFLEIVRISWIFSSLLDSYLNLALQKLWQALSSLPIPANLLQSILPSISLTKTSVKK